MRYFEIVDGEARETSQKTHLTVETVKPDGSDTWFGPTASAEGLEFVERCSCNEGTGGCKQSSSTTCTPEGVAACIRTLVENCDR